MQTQFGVKQSIWQRYTVKPKKHWALNQMNKVSPIQYSIPIKDTQRNSLINSYQQYIYTHISNILCQQIFCWAQGKTVIAI